MLYDEIKDLALRYADRNDPGTVDRVDDFILMAEARVNRLLKTRQQTGRFYTPTVDNLEYYPLPSDYIGLRDIQINSTTPTVANAPARSMKYLTPQQIDARRGNPSLETYYTIIDNQIQIYPAPPAGYTIEIVYYQKVPNLNSTDNTNWLSEHYPDIYVSAIAAEICLYVKDYPAASIWTERVGAAIDELSTTDAEERWTAASLTMRAE